MDLLDDGVAFLYLTSVMSLAWQGKHPHATLFKLSWSRPWRRRWIRPMGPDCRRPERWAALGGV